MTQIIKNRQAVADNYTLVTLAEGEAPASTALPTGAIIVPLAVWQAQKSELTTRGTPVGVWLDVTEGAEDVADDLASLPVIAVNFPKFTDGRGYSTARLLRERYGYTGEIRAIGDVLHDQLFLMARCGFDAFALREGKDIAKALNAFATFKTPYQAAADESRPLFRRRTA
ncbi:MAG: DUF934 domain-containing protein [Zoogloeaceae bacterium]|nr:DUF934 domain-containing protein [Zoogloeaceae bacterium]